MSVQRAIFGLLAAEENPAADDALAAALPAASAQTSRAIVHTLLTRHQPRGMYALVEQFHHLDASARDLVIAQADHVFSALREAFNSKEDRVRHNVLDLIRVGRMYRASYLLETGLHDRDAKIREAAAIGLHELADTIVCEDSAVDVSPMPDTQDAPAQMTRFAARREDRRQLATAVAGGLACFSSHLQPKVVEAGMWLIDDLGLRFWTCITTPGSRALRAAIGVMEQALDHRMVPFAVGALAHNELRPHALKVLAMRCDRAFMTEWLREGWRLALPRVARATGAVHELACLQDKASALLDGPADAERHLARWIRYSGLSNQARGSVLRELYRRGSQETRRSAIGAMTECFDETTVSLLRAVAAEKDADGSQIARLELARRYPCEYPPTTILGGTKNAFAEALAQKGFGEPERAEPVITLDMYLAQFDLFDAEERVNKGREAVERSARPVETFAAELTHADAAHRLRALKAVTLLNLGPQFAKQLYGLSHDVQAEIRSAAILALGQIPNPTSKRIIHQALSDPDERVQANAVEAADESGQVALDALLEKLSSPDNRVRANAVKALLKMGVREAAQTLVLMLEDSDRRQRASALWLVEKMGLFTLTNRVVRMATKDQDPQVRAKAVDIRRRLMEPEEETFEVLP